jgi:hypothetical protein
MLVSLTAAPWHAAYLVPTGVAILLIFNALFGADGSAGALLLVFFGVLLSIRLGAVALRRMLPVSREVHNGWFQNRLLAKHYDSYHWQKLFWVGLGMALHTRSADHLSRVQAWVVVTCVVSGLIGMIYWKSAETKRDASAAKSRCA